MNELCGITGVAVGSKIFLLQTYVWNVGSSSLKTMSSIYVSRSLEENELILSFSRLFSKHVNFIKSCQHDSFFDSPKISLLKMLS